MSRGMQLSAEGLRRRYAKRLVVDVDRFEAEAGRTTCVIGPSGSGKTTLLALLGLLERADEGQVYVDGRPVGVRDKWARMHMAAAFQSPYLFKATVGENVAYGLKLRGVPARDRARATRDALERVGLGGWERRAALTLSGGEAQRVALARALVLRPRILFLDEPLASLDPIAKGHLAADFARIVREDGITTVYVTHDQIEALAVGDDVLVLRDGRAVARGPADELMMLPPDAWTARFLGTAEPLRGVVTASSEGLVTVDVGGVVIHAGGTHPVGAEVLLGVRPEDVLLFAADSEFPAASARNRLLATVSGVGSWGVLPQVVLDVSGSRLLARISRASMREMEIETGRRLQAVFKAAAVRVMPAGDRPAEPPAAREAAG